MAVAERTRRRANRGAAEPLSDEAVDALIASVARWRERLDERKAAIAATPGLHPAEVTAQQGVLQPRIELARIEARREIHKPAKATERALLALAALHILDDVPIAELNQAYQRNPRAFELACRTPSEQLLYKVIRR